LTKTEPKPHAPTLAEMRSQLGVSQRALARALNVSPRTVFRWEHDLNRMHPVYTLKLQRMLDALLKNRHTDAREPVEPVNG